MKNFIKFLYNIFFVKDVIPVTPTPQPIIPTPAPAHNPDPVVIPPSQFYPKIALWCQLAKQMEGALPYRNNPGNLRFRGQKYAVNDNGFCKFDTYEHGYNALWNLFFNACSGKSANYVPDETIYQFYAGIPLPNKYKRTIGGYAPASDNNKPNPYAEFVAKGLGVPPTTKIQDLL